MRRLEVGKGWQGNLRTERTKRTIASVWVSDENSLATNQSFALKIIQPKDLFIIKFVADAPDGQNQLRVIRVIFNLRPQAIDVRINRAVVAFVGIIPDFFEQIFARKNTSGI